MFAACFNDFLHGTIPSSIFNISSLKVLSLQQNNFSGNLPPYMGLSLSNLQELYLYLNKLSGKIPSSITNASQLIVVELNRNSFMGSIPDFGNLRRLEALRLWENNLTGAESPHQVIRFLSSLTNCRELQYLEISDNPQMNGILPASIGNLSTDLVTFAASNCNIKGSIPQGIVNLSSLHGLYLHQNQLTGDVPIHIGNLKQLEGVNLGTNHLQGFIPHGLCQMRMLNLLNLSENFFTGPVPGCLGRIRNLREVYLDSNKLNSTIPLELWNLTDLTSLNLSSNYLNGELSSQIGRLKAINELDLSCNQFSGDIPSLIAGCTSLEFLSLSNNSFGGSIPQSFENMRSLNALYLSHNNLSGFIPKNMANLDLMYLDVSYNKLEGEIPDRGCFINFTAESFVHNYALCGVARFGVLNCVKQHAKSRLKSVTELMKYILPPVLSALILVAFAFMVIRRCKPKKIPYKDDTSVGDHWRRVSYLELVRGTNSFGQTSLLGRGSFGSVFKAMLSDDLDVAVKVFDMQSEGSMKSFETESQILSNIRHRNLLGIIGCCSNVDFKALILEYMPNGSLENWLHSENCWLDLLQRVNIAIDVALALEYLHHGYTFPIVHCDIKPNNVLLDKDMTARVGDFGISKLFEEGQTEVLTKTLATVGYAAPEYGSEGKVSTNGDVYSYGIMLLEMLTGKKPTDDIFIGNMSFKEWIGEAMQENTISEVTDHGLVAREDRHFNEKEGCVSSIFHVAMKCLVISPHERINMIEAAATLKKIRATHLAGTIRR
ncbi:probable LRR receptor-like serine/threonine-protein kinase At3g47570 [Salvia hispanica]|uniref:probable LRR receptor-like serine/threonine-protein kinase At3g47570 n=1 Tax=Salvia hispanica TaxID=49212 RepID=UPI0020096E70|nr:probable LRR receptor-like serine/threonine-protein kinase At3g47570 [Salvia hispanica]